MNQRFMCCVFAVLFLGLGAGCLHTPPVGATRGVVLLENMNYMDGDAEDAFVGVLTGIAIDEHTILTAAHLFRYDPEAGHPIKINGKLVGYTVLSDGWSGMRDSGGEPRFELSDELVHMDFMVLAVDEPVAEYGEYVGFGMEDYDRLSDITLLTNEVESGLRVARPLRGLGFRRTRNIVYASLPQRQQEKYYLSGSPVVGTYPDGGKVLIGLATADGTVDTQLAGIRVDQESVFWVTAFDFFDGSGTSDSPAEPESSILE